MTPSGGATLGGATAIGTTIATGGPGAGAYAVVVLAVIGAVCWIVANGDRTAHLTTLIVALHSPTTPRRTTGRRKHRPAAHPPRGTRATDAGHRPGASGSGRTK